MIKKPITLKLRDGLEARPIALLVQEANQYSSTVVADGDDEADAIQGVEKLLVTE